jgi:hypothetical protein
MEINQIKIKSISYFGTKCYCEVGSSLVLLYVLAVWLINLTDNLKISLIPSSQMLSWLKIEHEYFLTHSYLSIHTYHFSYSTVWTKIWDSLGGDYEYDLKVYDCEAYCFLRWYFVIW